MLDDLRKGRRGAVARAISIMEDDPRGARRLLKSIFRHTGGSTVIGVTGPAGAGKSTLIDGLAVELGRLGARPAVLAVDPTSHVTGGAILGDRVRMAGSTDSGTYIRSVASRGAAGAVSGSIRNMVRVLEYAGFDPVIIESVGAGQTEVAISAVADVTVVVYSPQTGDSIQAIKAGLTEIGDIYVVNKGDLAGASRLLDAVRDFVGGHGGSPEVARTSAKTGRGVPELASRLRGLMGTGREDRGARLEAEVRDIVLSNVRERASEMLASSREFGACLEKVLAGRMDPHEAAGRVSRGLM